MRKTLGRDGWVKGCKERGEWAELCFMARAAGMGMGVLKPYGDSRLYDVAVEDGGRILRVQVKSTIHSPWPGEYSVHLVGPKRKKYPKGSVDFFAVFVIPVDEWYIIPYEATGRRLTLQFTPGSEQPKWERYLEAWELLGGVGCLGCGEREGPEQRLVG